MNAKNLKFFLEKNLIRLDGPEGLRAIIPLIYVENFNEREVIVVRWNSSEEKDAYQHEFHLCISLDQIYSQCAADPGRFRVIFMGQLKDFPTDALFYREMVSNFEHDMEKWVLFAVAPIGLRDGIPVNFATEIVLIGEGGRLIRPETYIKMDEWRSAEVELSWRCAS